MTYQYRTLGLAAAMAVGTIFALTPVTAEAATIYATSAEEIGDASETRGTQNDRDNLDNALGSNFDTFFELGFGGVVEFQFGKKFSGPGSVVEITTMNPDNWPEAMTVEVGTKGDENSFKFADPNPFTNSDTTFTFGGGPFDTVRLTDITRTLDGFRSTNGTGGFDVAAIGVTPVPLPASALLLLGGFGGLGGLAALRRRKQAV